MEPILDLGKQKAYGFQIHDQWAWKHVNRAVREEWNKLVYESLPLPRSGLLDPHLIPRNARELPRAPQAKPVGEAPREATKIKFGIIGAGAAGLFAGMILDWFNSQSSEVQFSYDILEASNRVGGRLYTYEFDGPGQHQYYDVGAMRFPDNAVMKRYVACLLSWLLAL